MLQVSEYLYFCRSYKMTIHFATISPYPELQESENEKKVKMIDEFNG